MSLQLCAISAGAVEFDKNIFLPAQPKGQKIAAPVELFLIRHAKGNVLVDTGIDPEAFADPLEKWGGMARAFQPKGTPQDGVVPRLQAAGVRPEAVGMVVNTHLHMDHAGGNRFLPWAVFYVQVAEMNTARDPKSQGNGYFRSDWDHPLSYHLIDGDADLLGDGSVLLKALPGHTPGSQSVVVNFNGRRVVLVGDVCPLAENLSGNIIPRNTYEQNGVLQAFQWLRQEQSHGAFLVFGHDPEQWPQVAKLFPAQS